MAISVRIFKVCSHFSRNLGLFSEKPLYNCAVVCSRNFTKLKPKLFTMKLDSAVFHSCITEEVKYVNDLFNKNGFEIRIVGGAVRDLLLGKQPNDLDFATTATPNDMKRMFNEEELRMICLTGEKHGTITPRINETNLEITTLRVDLVTDGRHAEVEFTKDWELDASRRDLTINAMFLGLDGTLYDYFNGYEDLKNHRIRFVGDAASRIKEDYLRILRYFRFYGKVSQRPGNHDQDVLKAIKDNLEGLSKISGERIWMELSKIATGNFAGELLRDIIEIGLGPYIGLKRASEFEELERVWNRLKYAEVSYSPVTLLSALFETVDDVSDFQERVKFSNFERDLALLIVENRQDEKTNLYPLWAHKRYIILSNRGSVPVKIKQAVELLKYQGRFDLIDELENWEIPKFPVSGEVVKKYLNEKGIKSKKQIGVVINELKKIWLEEEYKSSADELILRLPDTLNSPEFLKYSVKNR